jgi:hypothetical protein
VSKSKKQSKLSELAKDAKDGVCPDEEKREGPATPEFLPWIFAVEDRDPGRWERLGKNPKRMGELSQAAFLVKAQSRGFGLALPWGDSEKYDFIVWARPGGRLLRVQVKATGRLNRGGYDVQPVYATRSEGKKTYTSDDIDVLAAHVVMEEKEVWYLLPVAAFEGVKSLRLFPDAVEEERVDPDDGRRYKKSKSVPFCNKRERVGRPVLSRNPRWEGYREAWEWLEGGE